MDWEECVQRRKEKWSSCSGKRPSHGIPCKPGVSFGRKGRGQPENGGKRWTQADRFVALRARCRVRMCTCRLFVAQTALSLFPSFFSFFFFMSGREKRYVLSQMFHWRAPHRQKCSGWGREQEDEADAGLTSLPVSQPGNTGVSVAR